MKQPSVVKHNSKLLEENVAKMDEKYSCAVAKNDKK